MSTPYGGNDPEQWSGQPRYGQQPGGANPPSGPQQQPGYGWPQQYEQQPGYPQQPEYQQPQQTQWGQQPPSYGQQPGYPQQGGGYPQTGSQQPPGFGQPRQQVDYGQPPRKPGAGEKKSKNGIWIGVGAVIVVIAAVGILGFVTPGFFVAKVFDNKAVQTGVSKILTENYKIQGVANVSCPAGQEVKEGNTFDCTATVAGKQQRVPIKVTSADGQYEVGIPVAK